MEVVDADGINGLINAMNQHINNKELIKNCCGALSVIAYNSESNKKAIAAAGGIDVLVDAGSIMNNDGLVYVCDALLYIVHENDANIKKIINKKFFRCNNLISEMLSFISINLKENNNINIIKALDNLCKIFSNTASFDVNIIQYIIDIINAVVDAMNTHIDVEDIQKNGCRALILINDRMSNSNENWQIVTDNHGIDAVIRAMNNHLNNIDIQKFGCRMINDIISYSNENIIKVTAAGGIEAVVKAIEMNMDNVDIVDNGCKALNIIITYNSRTATAEDFAEMSKRFMESDGIKSMVNVIIKYKNRKETKVKACDVLINIANSDNIPKILFNISENNIFDICPRLNNIIYGDISKIIDYILINKDTITCENLKIFMQNFNKNFDPEGNKFIITKCKHIFHKECIDKWIKLKLTCPQCRTEIKSESNTYLENNDTNQECVICLGNNIPKLTGLKDIIKIIELKHHCNDDVFKDLLNNFNSHLNGSGSNTGGYKKRVLRKNTKYNFPI